METIATTREILVVQNADLVEMVRPFYDETMEYHNFEGHILGTWESARNLAKLCINAGVAVNLAVTDRSVLLHDADLHKPLTTTYATLDRRSAAIARSVLREFVDSEDIIKQSSDSIIASSRARSCMIRAMR